MAERFENSSLSLTLLMNYCEYIRISKVEIMTKKRHTDWILEDSNENEKKVSQDYRKAINEGQRSGSGKLVCKN